ncbi:MAG: EamA family transporter [Chloroflexi bacterium HGW-Chloroflexi-2]|jgi:drug/metabolite transporter (DMT)-like permease|nr:MAG: EamA family transporter [Chloroflexi bacterium HGW-Chloroflexi-2]
MQNTLTLSILGKRSAFPNRHFPEKIGVIYSGQFMQTGRQLTRIQADLLLLLTAAVWGSGFIAQRIAAPNMNIFYFNGGRFLLGALLLIPLVRFKLHIEKKKFSGVLLAGFLLFSAGAFQQAGMITTTAGNAGFITGLYVIFVPIFLWLIWRDKQKWNVWMAAAVAVIGMLLLSTGGKLNLAPGDRLELIGAILWAMHVIVVGRTVQGMHPLHFAIGQFMVCAILNFGTGFIIDPQGLTQISSLWWTILYNGIASVAIGFTLQGVAQKYAPPTDAALILSMEAVFAAVFGFVFLSERFSSEQLIGGILVMAAILLAQANFSPKHLIEAEKR